MTVTTEHKLSNDEQNGRQINEQTRQVQNNRFECTLHTKNKIIQEIDYFLEGLGMKADRVISAENTQ